MRFLPFVIMLICAAGCSSRVNTESSGQNTTLDAKQAYFSILGNLNPEFPGRGTDVYNDIQADRAMAYGHILSAEANRFVVEGDTSALAMVRKSGNWLINHSDLNNNGITGYGLADAWDAFGDSTVNPVFLEYTITNAVVVKALLDWWECDKSNPRAAEGLNIALKVLTPYLDSTYDSPLGIPAYSLSEYDRKYDVFNPAAYLAGQMQRMARITADDSIRARLEKKSEKTMSVMIQNQLRDENDNIYWNYSINHTRPNDLIHMAYIVEGLRDYKANGGQLALPWEKVIGHISLFKPGNTWYERVEKNRHTKEENVRLWALGLLMYTLAMEDKHQVIKDTLLPQIARYRKADGRFKFKENDERTMIRQDAHVLLGLSYYLFNK